MNVVARLVVTLALLTGAAAVARTQTVVLRHRFVAGEKRLYTKVQKRVMKSQLGERRVTQEMTRTTDMTLVVERVLPDGSARARLVIQRIRLLRTGPGENTNYDSAAKKNADADFSLSTLALDALAGAEFAFVMTPRGQLQNVRPTAQTTARLTKAGAGGLLPTLTAGVKYLAPVLPLPATPVTAGATWTDPLRLDVPSLGTITGTYTFTYRGAAAAGAKPGTARIETTSSDVALKPAANALIEAKVNAFDETGTIDWDQANGRLVRRAATNTMTMTITVQGKTATQNSISQDTLQLVATR